jgi:multidrug transporter EmrE-like cation transporter
MGNFLMMFISIGLAIAGQLFMKQGMMMVGKFPITELLPRLFSILFQPFVFLGIALYGLSSIFWLVVLSRIELSLAYPIVSISYVIVALFSFFVFKESVSLIRWMGILTILLGVILVSRS